MFSGKLHHPGQKTGATVRTLPGLLTVFAVVLISSIATAENRVTLGCPIVKPIVDGDSVGIPVYLTNDVTLGGFSLGFSYNSNDVEITSVSTAGSVLPALAPGDIITVFRPITNRVAVGWIDHSGSNPLESQTGGLGFTLWMRIPLGTPQQCIDLDSSFVAPSAAFLFAPKVGGAISPDYSDCGMCDVSTFDNRVTIGCPITKPVVDGDSVGIPVYLSNNVSLGGFSLGFNYGSNDVEITSVSTAGSVLPALGAGDFLTAFHPNNNNLLVLWLDHSGSRPLAPQVGGLGFTLWMRVPVGTPSQWVNIDSTFVPPAGFFIFAPKSGSSISPAYSDCGVGDVKIGDPSVIWNYHDFGDVSFDNFNNWSPIDYPSGVGHLPYPGTTGEGGERYDLEGLWFAYDSAYVYVALVSSFGGTAHSSTYNRDYVQGDVFMGFDGEKYQGCISGTDYRFYTVSAWVGIPDVPGGFGSNVTIKNAVGGYQMYHGTFARPVDHVFTLYGGMESGYLTPGDGDTWVKEYRILRDGSFPFNSADTIVTWHVTLENGADMIEKSFPICVAGDANHDGSVDISDAVYSISYIFAGGPPPVPHVAGDANCDAGVDISDVVYLIQYIFANGPAPCIRK
jgi:hypothetical protein